MGEADTTTVRSTTTERTNPKTCGACGRAIVQYGRGRPRRYCDATCRTRAWAIRRAAEQLGKELPAPVVEVREQTLTRTVAPRGPRVPTDPRGWNAMLDELAQQLRRPASITSARHWDHRSIYEHLVRAMAALGEAHPGGLDRLSARR
ncbi:hypothetical protein [Streptomyces sp. NPDC051173]|uniref:hypothetical protein n=1 Tax=Streptomyces sp. NPDC051173 TaxID=3155164 RepID=UPI00344BD13F